jgi:hypothetical protein
MTAFCDWHEVSAFSEQSLISAFWGDYDLASVNNPHDHKTNPNNVLVCSPAKVSLGVLTMSTKMAVRTYLQDEI